ncbi:MAG: hypothetical protein GWN58_24180, partial [Anaerolineae bacterium]|nr:hypothetical protein [Anaerolineae bacterium]
MSTLPEPRVPEWQQPHMFYGKPLIYHHGRHMYFWGGEHVPSVTTIIKRLDKPGLVQWAADCAVEYIKAKGTFDGSDVWGVSSFDLDNARKAHRVK